MTGVAMCHHTLNASLFDKAQERIEFLSCRWGRGTCRITFRSHRALLLLCGFVVDRTVQYICTSTGRVGILVPQTHNAHTDRNKDRQPCNMSSLSIPSMLGFEFKSYLCLRVGIKYQTVIQSQHGFTVAHFPIVCC